ncbi:MAG: hypothetical protein ACRBN8_26755 [Nannocystales bacterium]
MQLYSSVLVGVLFLAGCASESPTTGQGGTSGGTEGLGTDVAQSSSSPGSQEDSSPNGSTGEGADASSGSGDSGLETIELDRGWVAELEGAWLGPVAGTPLGDLPQFYWEFAWTDTDALVGVADSGMGFRFEFEFAEHDGQWTLLETGTLPGDITQSYELHPVSREGDLVRFEVLDQPGYLQVDILPGEGRFDMAVFVRGEPHGTFDLAHPG